jgi:hypothetical protein
MVVSGLLALCLVVVTACGENTDSEEVAELEARVAELESELRAASSSTAITTTTTEATTTRPTTARTSTTSSLASQVDDAEVVESIRRVAVALSRSLGGVALSSDILTDRQIVEDVKALCLDVQGDREGLAQRYEMITADVHGAAELALLKVKVTWAVGYCPDQQAVLAQVAADIDDALADVSG